MTNIKNGLNLVIQIPKNIETVAYDGVKGVRGPVNDDNSSNLETSEE